MHILIDAKGVQLLEGDTVTDFRGDKWTLRGFTPPHKPGSTGRALLEATNPQSQMARHEFYPGVIDAKIIELSDNVIQLARRR